MQLFPKASLGGTEIFFLLHKICNFFSKKYSSGIFQKITSGTLMNKFVFKCFPPTMVQTVSSMKLHKVYVDTQCHKQLLLHMIPVPRNIQSICKDQGYEYKSFNVLLTSVASFLIISSAFSLPCSHAEWLIFLFIPSKLFLTLVYLFRPHVHLSESVSIPTLSPNLSG